MTVVKQEENPAPIKGREETKVNSDTNSVGSRGSRPRAGADGSQLDRAKGPLNDKFKFFLANLPPSVTALEMRRHFEAYGNVNYVKLIYNKSTGVSMGYGFLYLMDEDTDRRVEEYAVRNNYRIRFANFSRIFLQRNDESRARPLRFKHSHEDGRAIGSGAQYGPSRGGGDFQFQGGPAHRGRPGMGHYGPPNPPRRAPDFRTQQDIQGEGHRGNLQNSYRHPQDIAVHNLGPLPPSERPLGPRNRSHVEASNRGFPHNLGLEQRGEFEPVGAHGQQRQLHHSNNNGNPNYAMAQPHRDAHFSHDPYDPSRAPQPGYPGDDYARTHVGGDAAHLPHQEYADPGYAEQGYVGHGYAEPAYDRYQQEFETQQGYYAAGQYQGQHYYDDTEVYSGNFESQDAYYGNLQNYSETNQTSHPAYSNGYDESNYARSAPFHLQSYQPQDRREGYPRGGRGGRGRGGSMDHQRHHRRDRPY